MRYLRWVHVACIVIAFCGLFDRRSVGSGVLSSGLILDTDVRYQHYTGQDNDHDDDDEQFNDSKP